MGGATAFFFFTTLGGCGQACLEQGLPVSFSEVRREFGTRTSDLRWMEKRGVAVMMTRDMHPCTPMWLRKEGVEVGWGEGV